MAISGNKNLLAYFTSANVAGSEELKAGFYVLSILDGSQDLKGIFDVGQDSADLKAGFESQVRLDLKAGFIVYNAGSADLNAAINVRHPNDGELNAGFNVSRTGWLSQGLSASVMRDLSVLA
jgi:hypothetical protein